MKLSRIFNINNTLQGRHLVLSLYNAESLLVPFCSFFQNNLKEIRGDLTLSLRALREFSLKSFLTNDYIT